MVALLLALTAVAMPEEGCGPWQWERYGLPPPCADAGLMAEWKLPPATVELARAAWVLENAPEAGDAWLKAVRSAPERSDLVVAMALRLKDDAFDGAVV